MWKKGELEEQGSAPQAHKAEEPHVELSPSAPRSGEQATICRSISIRGDVTGDEDLVIQGRVDGSVSLAQHGVTVGPEGQVKANISARIVTVEGRVEGNLTGDEQVILRRSARVEGDIMSPRVVLEEGAYFRGGVDMGEAVDQNRLTLTTPASKAASAGPVSASRAAAQSTAVKTAEVAS